MFLILFLLFFSLEARYLGWWEVGSGVRSDTNNKAVYSITVDTTNKKVYVATLNNNGIQIFSSSNGSSWNGGLPSGIDSSNTNSKVFEYFKGYLVLGTINSNGARIYRSSNGSNWSLVASSSTWGVNYSSITAGIIFNDFMYVALKSNTNVKIYKSSDTLNWTEIFSESVTEINDFEEFNNALYFVTKNGKIYSSSDGTNFSEVSITGLTATEITSIAKFNGSLYIAVKDSNSSSIWKYDGTLWSGVTTDLPQSETFVLGKEFETYNGKKYLFLVSKGTAIYYSENASNWNEADYSCFKDTDNTKILIKEAEIFNGFYYVPTYNEKGVKIYRTNGTWGVVINKICYYPSGLSSPAEDWSSETRRWIELYNYSNNDIDLSGWRFDFGGSGGWGDSFWIPSGTIPAKGHFLIEGAEHATSEKGDFLYPLSNLTYPSDSTPYCRGVRFADNSGFLQDKVVYSHGGYSDLYNLGAEGSNPVSEETSSGDSIIRNPEGFDSDNNDNDFTDATASPQNSGLVWETYSGNMCITEVAPAMEGGKDLIEFYVLSDGSLDNYQVYSGTTLLKDFPAINAKKGDFVVLHLGENKQDEVYSNTTTVNNNYWDIYSSTYSLPDREGVISLRIGAGNYEDVINYSDYDGNLSTITAQNYNLTLTDSDGWNGDTALISGNSVLNVNEVEDNFVYFDGISSHTLMRWLDYDYSPIDRNNKYDFHIVTNTTNIGEKNERLQADLIITEIAPSESGGGDWIEFYATRRGSLKGLRIYENNYLVKILPDVFVEKGDYILLHFNDFPTKDELTSKGSNNYWDFYTDDTGLTGSDNLISIRRDDNVWKLETILDCIAFTNGDGDISSTFAEAYNYAVNNGYWTGELAIISDNGLPLNASQVESYTVSPWTENDGDSISRNYNLTHSSYTDSNGRDDFNISQVQTPGTVNRAGGTGEVKVLITEIAPSESSDWVEFYAVENSSIGGLQFYELYKLIKTFPDVYFKKGEYFVLNFGGNEEDDEIYSDTNGNGYRDFYTSRSGLTGTDNVIYIKSSTGKFIDGVCYSNNDGTLDSDVANAYNRLISTGQWAGVLAEIDKNGNVTNKSIVENYMAGKWDETAGHSIVRISDTTGVPEDTNEKKNFTILSSQSKGKGYETALQSNKTIEVFQSPFSPYGDGKYSSAKIVYNVPDNTSKLIYVFDVQGRIVKELLNESSGAGSGVIIWDGRDDDGNIVPVGVYIVYIEATNTSTGDVTKAKDLVVVGRKF